MSQTDSFIDEVTEAVRKDRLYGYLRRYAWIGVLVVLLIVGGAAYNEWSKAKARDAAQSLGDSVLAALEQGDEAARSEALGAIEPPNAAARAVVDLLASAEMAGTDPAAAAARLIALADAPEVAPVYRQIATLKAVAIPDSGLSPEDRRMRLEGLTLSSGMTRLLAEEQLALLEIETGDSAAAITRLTAIAEDAEATAGLRRRASQVIVALGGEPSEVGDSQ